MIERWHVVEIKRPNKPVLYSRAMTFSEAVSKASEIRNYANNAEVNLKPLTMKVKDRRIKPYNN